MTPTLKLPILTMVLCFIASAGLFAQKDYRLKGLFDLDERKAPQREYAEKLSWAAINSDCIPKGSAELGTWFKVEAKGSEMTITVTTGGKSGNLNDPIIYFGKSINDKGNDILIEVACNSSKDGSVSVSTKELKNGEEYYVLVTSKQAKPNQFYSIQRFDQYNADLDPLAKTEVKAQEKKQRVVMGRIRRKDGTPKSGVLVTLLNEEKQPLETASTDAEGRFHFKKLPTDETVLTRIEEDDTELVIDMFLLSELGEVESRATRIGTSLYGFGAAANGFKDLVLLTEKDWAMNVASGKQGVTGKIVDAETYLFGQNKVEVGLYNSAKSKLATTQTDLNGRFEFRDVDKGDYRVRVEGNREGQYSEMVIVDDLNVPFLFSNSNMSGADGFFDFKKLPSEVVEMKRMEVRDSQMKIGTDFSKMEEGKPIVLKNILFASGSSDLLPSSHAELDKLAAALRSRPAIKVEISGHTDNTGNPAINKQLSQSRAESVKDYLVSKGISADRMTFKGFGDTKPVATNDTEEGRKQNRRVEFVVVK